MRSVWQKIHDEIHAQFKTASFQKDFQQMQRMESRLAGFVSPAGLVEHQHSMLTSKKDKDEVLRALVRLYQTRPYFRNTAGALLLASMWPGLTGVFHKVARTSPLLDDPEAEVFFAFFQQVLGIRLETNSNISASLKMNTLRDVLSKVSRRKNDLNRQQEAIETHEGNPEEAFVLFWRSLPSKDKGFEPDEPEIQELIRRMEYTLGLKSEEAQLLAYKGVCNLPWERIGHLLSTKPETARKRYQRLLKKLKHDKELEKTFG